MDYNHQKEQMKIILDDYILLMKYNIHNNFFYQILMLLNNLMNLPKISNNSLKRGIRGILFIITVIPLAIRTPWLTGI